MHRVTVAGDIGPIVNMSGAENQVEGSVIDGFSTAMGLSISIENGRIQETNFDRYPLLRIANAPQIDVHFIQSDYLADRRRRAGAAAGRAGDLQRDLCRDRPSRAHAAARRKGSRSDGQEAKKR